MVQITNYTFNYNYNYNYCCYLPIPHGISKVGTVAKQDQQSDGKLNVVCVSGEELLHFDLGDCDEAQTARGRLLGGLRDVSGTLVS